MNQMEPMLQFDLMVYHLLSCIQKFRMLPNDGPLLIYSIWFPHQYMLDIYLSDYFSKHYLLDLQVYYMYVQFSQLLTHALIGITFVFIKAYLNFIINYVLLYFLSRSSYAFFFNNFSFLHLFYVLFILYQLQHDLFGIFTKLYYKYITIYIMVIIFVIGAMKYCTN